MSYFNATNLPDGLLAQQYTMRRQLLPLSVRRIIPESSISDRCHRSCIPQCRHGHAEFDRDG
jgi:hypothetical protein